ncbi:hypothetical protein CYMTET_54902 [Cymbomonas tetramitiformis]|uniref:Uncharacterized protein n=1 Tax=Cymbomonas tetramitiformis TaxID=36881 RepID=A0AAE0BFD2_9CHLO|nr:hypothetical protein CYMTET_54902 [Cymbomonas tetramitiformis]
MLSLAIRSQHVCGKASERLSFRTQATAGLRKAPARAGLDSRHNLQVLAKKTNPEKTGSGAKGFGAKSPAASTAKPASSFTLLTKDELATAHEFFLFARKPDGRWLPIGDISVKDGKDAPDAIKERRGVLVEYTEQRYMALKCLKKGENIEFGYRLQRGST